MTERVFIPRGLILVLIPSLPLTSTAQSGGETKQTPSGWTVDTLKAHYDALNANQKEYEARLEAERDKRYDQRFQAQEKAQDSYRVSSNEFRGSLSDANNRFISRSELGGYVTGLVMVMGVLVAWLAWSTRKRSPST